MFHICHDNYISNLAKQLFHLRIVEGLNDLSKVPRIQIQTFLQIYFSVMFLYQMLEVERIDTILFSRHYSTKAFYLRGPLETVIVTAV